MAMKAWGEDISRIVSMERHKKKQLGKIRKKRKLTTIQQNVVDDVIFVCKVESLKDDASGNKHEKIRRKRRKLNENSFRLLKNTISNPIYEYIHGYVCTDCI